MCDLLVSWSSRKYPYPPHGRSLEILSGWGVSKAKSFKGKYGGKLEFLEGWGEELNPKNTFHGGGMDIFWNNTLRQPLTCDLISHAKVNIF